MRQEREFDANVRSSALWGKGGRGDGRSSALWGKGGQGVVATTVASLALILPLAAGANGTTARAADGPTYVAPAVFQAAEQNPNGTLALIVRSTGGATAAKRAFTVIEEQAKDEEKAAKEESDGAKKVADEAVHAAKQAAAAAEQAQKDATKAREEATRARADADGAQKNSPKKAKQAEEAALKAEQRALAAEAAATGAAGNAQAAAAAAAEATAKAAQAATDAERKKGDAEYPAQDEQDLDLIGGVVAQVKSRAVRKLARVPGLTVTLDSVVKKADYTSDQLWVHQAGASKLWPAFLRPAPKGATIAVIDSGIEKDHSSFGGGGRLIDRQNFTSLSPNTGNDGRGHGTFVAGIAAGEAAGYTGVSPTSELVDLDVMDDTGRARTSDVIKACEWVLDNKESNGIRVVNMSLHSSSVLSIKYHPLNRAVEKLWFSGVVVVAAAGNYGVEGGPSGVTHAPGNDPFVITVGAVDLNGAARPYLHDIPSWSAWGYTNEGFAKPDVVAAGRYMVGPVSQGATLATEKPDNVVAPGYMRLSGTSFASPVVAGIAAQIIARHPGFTPDQVKGAVMTTARRIPEASRLEQGRGEVNAVRATLMLAPPNPNAGLNRFVVADPAGGPIPVFDASAWYSAMRNDTAWDSSAWGDSAWNDSAWNDSGADSAWADSAWADSAWNDSAWNDSAWADSASYEDNAEGEGVGVAQPLTDEAEAEIENDPALAPPKQ